MIGLLGGLQSRNNPGRNLAPGVAHRPRRPRLGAHSVAPQTGWGNSHGWGGSVPPGYTPPPQPPQVYHPPATPPPPWHNPWADPTHQGNANWQGHPYGTPPPPAPSGPALPAGHAIALPAPPATSILSFDDWLRNQPGWTEQNAIDTNSRNQLYAQYGWYRDANGNLVADTKAGPDSILAQLGNHRARQVGDVAQAGANHGNLFSGASLAGVQGATEAYNKGVSDAQKSLLGSLGKVDQAELDTKNALRPDYGAMVESTKTSKPEDFLHTVHGMRGADAVASIDAYLKKYGQYLSPAQKQAYAQERARQQNIAEHQTHHAQSQRTHPQQPTKPKKRRRRRAPTRSVPGRTHNGGVAGGMGV